MFKRIADVMPDTWIKDDDGAMSYVVDVAHSSSGTSTSLTLHNTKQDTTHRTDFYDNDTIVETKPIQR